MMRIDKLLSQSGYGSRAEVRQLIRRGRVALNQQTIQDPGRKISTTERALLTLDDQPVEVHDYLYFMLHKPRGYLTALEDRRHQTIAEFIPEQYRHKDLAPVGRLDLDTSGLLLLTNHGVLAHRLCSPKWAIRKKYYLEIEGLSFDAEAVTCFAAGFSSAAGTFFQPALLEILNPASAYLTIREGKYHQVKRMMSATGRQVTRLHRIQIDDLRLDDGLPEGGIRLLKKNESDLLLRACRL